MAEKGGLIELILVFGLVLGFGLLELRSLRRDTKKAAEQAKEKAGRPEGRS